MKGWEAGQVALLTQCNLGRRCGFLLDLFTLRVELMQEMAGGSDRDNEVRT